MAHMGKGFYVPQHSIEDLKRKMPEYYTLNLEQVLKPFEEESIKLFQWWLINREIPDTYDIELLVETLRKIQSLFVATAFRKFSLAIDSRIADLMRRPDTVIPVSQLMTLLQASIEVNKMAPKIVRAILERVSKDAKSILSVNSCWYVAPFSPNSLNSLTEEKHRYTLLWEWVTSMSCLIIWFSDNLPYEVLKTCFESTLLDLKIPDKVDILSKCLVEVMLDVMLYTDARRLKLDIVSLWNKTYQKMDEDKRVEFVVRAFNQGHIVDPKTGIEQATTTIFVNEENEDNERRRRRKLKRPINHTSAESGLALIKTFEDLWLRNASNRTPIEDPVLIRMLRVLLPSIDRATVFISNIPYFITLYIDAMSPVQLENFFGTRGDTGLIQNLEAVCWVVSHYPNALVRIFESIKDDTMKKQLAHTMCNELNDGILHLLARKGDTYADVVLQLVLVVGLHNFPKINDKGETAEFIATTLDRESDTAKYLSDKYNTILRLTNFWNKK